MTQKEEVQIAFAIWELLVQLETLLRERYFDEFNEILFELETQRGMGKHYPFYRKK